MNEFDIVAGLLVAALGGAAVGVERQRSGHASGAAARFGGVRTFTLLGGASGLAGVLTAAGHTALGAIVAAGAIALIVTGYVAASRREVDATTEVAAVVVVCAGIAAGLGDLVLASGIIAVTTLLLIEKTRLHALVARLDDEEIRAAVRFAVMAVVILPLLPRGPFGPLGGVRPRELWLLVLFFSGLSFAGYVARRLVGPAHGYAVAGLLGGIVSSTSVTLAFARASRGETAMARSLAAGTIAACTVLYVRVLVATAVLAPEVARALVPRLAAALVVGLGALAIGAIGGTGERSPVVPRRNPLQLATALQMAITFQLVLYAVAIVRAAFGAPGLLASGAVLGLTDVDALTISMAKASAAGVAATTAADAITIGVIANCGLKIGIAVAFGTRVFSRASGVALAAMMVVMGIALRVLR